MLLPWTVRITTPEVAATRTRDAAAVKMLLQKLQILPTQSPAECLQMLPRAREPPS